MLLHRSGSKYEDMYWIDLDTGKIIAQELESEIEEEIIYSEKTKKALGAYPNILTIHTHLNSYPPSINDLRSNYFNDYQIGIVICHNGTVYIYSAEEDVEPMYYDFTIAEYIKQGNKERDAQMMTLQEIAEKFSIHIKEVTNDA